MIENPYSIVFFYLNSRISSSFPSNISGHFTYMTNAMCQTCDIYIHILYDVLVHVSVCSAYMHCDEQISFVSSSDTQMSVRKHKHT